MSIHIVHDHGARVVTVPTGPDGRRTRRALCTVRDRRVGHLWPIPRGAR